MATGPVLGRSRLDLNHTIFYVAAIFFYAGAISGTVVDLKLMDPITLGTDVMAFVVFTAVTILAIRRTISYGLAMLICFIQTCGNFLVGEMRVNIGYPNDPSAWFANPQLLIVFSLFGIVGGIAVHRMAALFFGGLFIATMAWFATSFKNSEFYQTWFVVDSSVVMGSMFLVYYYRGMLETLVKKLDGSLDQVKDLKVKAETIHEQNKPFVVFGQNTAGLVNDFQNDVLIIDSEIGVLRGDLDTELTSKSLMAMSDAVNNLNQRIEWVKYVASASPQRQEEMINVRKLVESALYPFTLQKEYQKLIQFSCDIPAGLHLKGYRRWLLQAVENLVRNACDSGAHAISLRALTHTEQNSVQEESHGDGKTFRMMVQISDDGEGYFTCYKCHTANCIRCPLIHGGTAYASAYMMAVRAVESLGGTIEVESHPSTGTTVSLYLDHATIIADPEYPHIRR